MHSHQRTDDLLGDYCDGEAYKNHSLFQKYTNSLEIMFYYDDLEVCNPTGSKCNVHKLGVLL